MTGASGPYEPRPVLGQREYSVIFEGKSRVIDAAYGHARRLVESVGAKLVKEDETSAIFVHEDADASLPLSLEVLGTKTNALQLRIRPDEVDHANYWPPQPFRQIAATLVHEHDLYDGPTRLRATPVTLRPMDVRPWMDNVLFSTDRQLPIVVLTPGPYTGSDVASQVAHDLAGIANVYVFSDAELARNWSYSITKERGVFGGAVRIYRADFTTESDPLAHDLLVPIYLERKFSAGRGSLSEELARRLLPMRSEPIDWPRPTPLLPPLPAIENLPRRKRPEERIRELEDHIDAIEQRNEELEEEVRRLNAAVRAQAERLRKLQDATASTAARLERIPGIPWPLENPEGYDVELSERFADDLARVARDGSLAEEVRKKMENALRHPEQYGKEMRGARHGQRCCYVARNYRLVWSVDGQTVRFVLIVSKEDPEYSPHGA